MLGIVYGFGTRSPPSGPQRPLPGVHVDPICGCLGSVDSLAVQERIRTCYWGFGDRHLLGLDSKV